MSNQDGPALVVRDLAVMCDAEWDFRDSAPKWRWRGYGNMATFDPFPAYPHDRAAVEEAAKYVQDACPPRWNVEVFIADREEVGRSNGFSYLREDGHYEGDQWVKDAPVGLIMLSGKRVPPHPAVTRYLVAHEYGHNVEWMLNKARGAKHSNDQTLATEYAAMRGLPQPIHHGSGGRWHDSAQEVFACDFRILVCGVEADYWPHGDIPHPAEVDGLRDWWTDALIKLEES